MKFDIQKNLEAMELVRDTFGPVDARRADIRETFAQQGLDEPWWWYGTISEGQFKSTTRGRYVFPLEQDAREAMELINNKSRGGSSKPRKPRTNKNKTAANAAAVAAAEAAPVAPAVEAKSFKLSRAQLIGEQDSYVPMKDKSFVAHGNFKDLKTIIKSEMFYPMWIAGLSGNGKTFSVEQACAQSKREVFRVNITAETDESDLLGSFKLVDGETVWSDGPVVTALKRGAVLLLDEIDLGSSKIMCLQPVLEGRGIYLKKIGEKVEPAPGFNVVATANTKGNGDNTGIFIGTNVMNAALMDRFAITFEQGYPTLSVSEKILKKELEKYGLDEDDRAQQFAKNIAKWASVIRENYVQGAIDEMITTRRETLIMKAYAIFQDAEKSIDLNINRFDVDVRESMKSFYTKVTGDNFNSGSDNFELNRDPENEFATPEK